MALNAARLCSTPDGSRERGASSVRSLTAHHLRAQVTEVSIRDAADILVGKRKAFIESILSLRMKILPGKNCDRWIMNRQRSFLVT
jgi:hypothetical protein